MTDIKTNKQRLLFYIDVPGTVLTSIVSYINSSILTIYSIWGVISHIFYTLNSISKITDSSKLFTLRPNLKNLM